MEVTLQDIARTLNASLVSLPGDASQSMGYADPTSPQGPNYRYQAQQLQLPGDMSRLTLGGPPPVPMRPPHPYSQHGPPHPGFGRPPPPPPPPPPGSHEAHVYRGSPIPPALLAGPRNAERQLA